MPRIRAAVVRKQKTDTREIREGGIKSDVKMKFIRFGSNIWITSAGLFVASRAIAIPSFAAIYFFSYCNPK